MAADPHETQALFALHVKGMAYIDEAHIANIIPYLLPDDRVVLQCYDKNDVLSYVGGYHRWVIEVKQTKKQIKRGDKPESDQLAYAAHRLHSETKKPRIVLVDVESLHAMYISKKTEERIIKAVTPATTTASAAALCVRGMPMHS